VRDQLGSANDSATSAPTPVLHEPPERGVPVGQACRQVVR
jgi:hypothetical protein